VEWEFAARPGLRIHLQQGDITRVAADAIVNAANERMLGGGGVDGAIHRAAGPELLEACRRVAEVRPGVRCPTGEARATPAFRLPATYVIHTVGPVYRGASRSGPLLASAHRSCLLLATELGVTTLAFPAVSCGVYRYPLDEAADISLKSCLEPGHSVRGVTFVLFDATTLAVWRSACQRALDNDP
jgi:O-acetyl-ADP-ribose deacetylase